MCGIAGILTPGPEAASQTAALNAMRCAIRHRGPDDQGTWMSPGGQAAFAHARLAIIDLSPAGHQPMSTADGRFTITFNGEIYNFRELRRGLEQRGAQFRTGSDTEVILKAVELDGPACLPRLRGMFAFALWDERERTCLLARDRFGIKPLYFHQSGGRLTFASELRALIASTLVPREVDAAGLRGFFMTGTVPEPDTLVRGVKCIEAGSYAVWRDGQLRSTRYWDLNFSDRHSEDPVDDTRRALIDSIAHHFVSDTPVGIFLSGGVDSTALVALARQAGQRDLRTYSLAFPGESEDESVTASQTADHFGTTHVEFEIDAASGRKLLSGFLNASDQPSIDGLNIFAVSKCAREHGVKVVLSGLGSDEWFGGYPSFLHVPRLHAWNRRLAMLGPLRGVIGRQLGRSSRDARGRRLGDALQRPPSLSRMYQIFRGVFTAGEAQRLVERYTGETVDEPIAMADAFDPTPQDAVSRLELTRYMRNQPLRDADTMSMAWGLELRVPFLDSGLADTLSGIPADVRLQRGKRLLLQAVPELPSWVTSQPKRGFFFPFRRWFDDEWHDMFAQIARESPVPTGAWYRTFSVFVFERWLEKLKAQPT